MQVPHRLGRYELTRLLGEGGAGRVYEAVLHGPAGFRKSVALKVLHDARSDLVREARLGGLLRHPNLVEVYELGQVDHHWYCAMELVTGGTLAQHLPLPPAAVVDVGLQVCAGLAHAHAAIGLVHLDLKPQNLLVQDGSVLIADLGIARAHDVGGTDSVRGTPGYMSPEQSKGRPLDERSDLFSLGVVLSELATGRRPERTVSPSPVPDGPWTDSTLDGPATVVMAPVPDWLHPITARCLAPDPDDRFDDAEALAAALRRLAIDGPTLYDVLQERGHVRRATPQRRRATPPASNIGPERNGFVGRVRELQLLATRLARPGITTVTGLGGAGKTRLARRAAAQYAAETGEQAWFVDLTEARNRADVVAAMASVLALRLPEGGEEDQLTRALGQRGAPLLVLDRMEHLAPASAWLPEISARVPHARFLATSRAPFRAAGEHVVRLEPLGNDDAAQLLVLRAHDLGTPQPLDDDLLQLAERLEGLPLAIELAAARLSTLTPAAMLELIHERLALLQSRGTSASRHQTMTATLDSSWSLLDARQQLALAEMTVFVGGFTLHAAEATLTPGEGALWVVDLVQDLYDASWLVRRPGAGPEPRMGMLDTVRAYVESKVQELPPGVMTGARTAHASAFATWYERFMGPQCLDDLDNLLSAFTSACGAGELGVAAACLNGVWFGLELSTGPPRAVELTRALLQRGPTGGDRGHALALYGHVLLLNGAAADAEPALREALPLLMARPTLRVRAMRSLAAALRHQGQLSESLELLTACLELVPGDPSTAAGALYDLGLHHRDAGDLEASLHWVSRALHAERLAYDPIGLGLAYSSRGVCLAELGRLDEAAACFRDALAEFEAVGALRFANVDRGNLAEVFSLQGRHEQAIEQFESVVTAMRRDGQLASLTIWLSNLADALIAVDRLAEAREALEEAFEHTHVLQQPRRTALVTCGLGWVCLHEGDLDAAERWFRASDELCETSMEKFQRVRVLCGWAQVQHRRGDSPRARQLLARAEHLAADMRVGPDSPPAGSIREARREIGS